MNSEKKGKKINFRAVLFDIALFAICFAFFSALFFFFLYYKGISPIYENVDDFFLKMLTSGEMTGENEIHLRYISLLSGCFLSLLYKINPSLSWYGIWLISCLLVSYSSVLWAFVKEGIKKKNRIIVIVATVVLFCVVFISFWSYSTYFVQYTTVTIVVAAAALVLYLTGHTLGSAVLFVLSSMIRFNAALMMLPFFAAFWLVLFLFNREKRKKITVNFACVMAGLVVVLLADMLGNRGVWADHADYDRARQTIVDYNS